MEGLIFGILWYEKFKNQIFITTNFSHNDIKLLEKSLHIEIYNPQKSSKAYSCLDPLSGARILQCTPWE